jgi:hypothetical protein
MIVSATVNVSSSTNVGMKLLNIETQVTINAIWQILLNMQGFASVRFAAQGMMKASLNLGRTEHGNNTFTITRSVL